MFVCIRLVPKKLTDFLRNKKYSALMRDSIVVVTLNNEVRQDCFICIHSFK